MQPPKLFENEIKDASEIIQGMSILESFLNVLINILENVIQDGFDY